jgi:acetolactate synthase-1/2/3 large subunit
VSDSADTARDLASALARAGTTLMFGVPGGGPNLDVVGAVEEAGIRFVLTHTETAAVIMAATHAELTGSPGASLMTRGPGLANAANGIADAVLDRQPVIVIADCVARGDGARFTHQRLDQSALGSSVAKGVGVIAAANATETVEKAIRLAIGAPRGPVVLDFDPSWKEADGEQLSLPAVAPPTSVTGDGGLARLRAELARSTRPLVALGVGAVRHAGTLRDVLVGRGVPVLATYKAKGVIPDSAPESAGLLTGGTIESRIIERADLVVGVGLDPVEMIPGQWDQGVPTVLGDDWDADRGGYFEADSVFTLPLRETVPALSSLCGSGWPAESGRRARLEARADLLACGSACATDGASGSSKLGVRAQELVVAARNAGPPGTTATVDSGAHMLVAMPLWDVEEPGEVLTSSGLATMGFALPAAIGAALARPGSRVVCFTGDGGLSMTLGELETLRRLDLDVTVVVFNDSTLSLIEIKQQQSGQRGESAVRYSPTSFAGVAEAHGIRAATVRTAGDLGSILAEAFAGPGPMLVDVIVDPSPYREILDLTRGEAGRRRPAMS